MAWANVRLTTSICCLLLSVVDRAAFWRVLSPHLVAAGTLRAVVDSSRCSGGFSAPRNKKNGGVGNEDYCLRFAVQEVQAGDLVLGPTYRASGIVCKTHCCVELRRHLVSGTKCIRYIVTPTVCIWHLVKYRK